MELAHGGLATDDAGDEETQLLDTLFEVNKNDIREYLEAIPASVDNNLAPIPDLARVAHPRLGQLVLVDLGLGPGLFLGVENENVIYYSLFAVAFPSPENYEVLAELSRRMTISSRGGLAGSRLTWVYFD